MLSILATPKLQPEIEAIDRDPGIVSFLSAIVKSTRAKTASVAAQIRIVHQRASATEMFSSATAWPDKHRAR